jgi:hypothetical protein
LHIIGLMPRYEARVTPGNLVNERLPWIYIVIGNIENIFVKDFHGGSGKYLPEYLVEFSYRFNRRFVEKKIPNRLLNLAIIIAPVKST